MCIVSSRLQDTPRILLTGNFMYTNKREREGCLCVDEIYGVAGCRDINWEIQWKPWKSSQKIGRNELST
jgi:hypothetical protein